MSIHRARRILGVTPATGLDAVKRRYRRLAREHHPDAGGRSERFAEIQAAFEVLVEHVPAGSSFPQAPRQDHVVAAREPRLPEVDVTSIDWKAPPPPGPTRLTQGLLARLASGAHAGPLRPVTARSRRPGGLLNRFANVLDDGLVSTLVLGRPLNHDEIAVRFQFRTRGARKRALQASLPFGWVRERTASDEVRALRRVPVSGDRRIDALVAAAVTVEALDALEWPVESWYVRPEG